MRDERGEEDINRVKEALQQAEMDDEIITLEVSQNAQPAKAAELLSILPGALVRTELYTIGARYVVALIAGDHVTEPSNLPRTLSLDGPVMKPLPDHVRAVTGFRLSGVSPAGMLYPLPTAIDGSLKRFKTLYVTGGTSHTVFKTTVEDLKKLTNGIVSYAVSKEG